MDEDHAVEQKKSRWWSTSRGAMRITAVLIAVGALLFVFRGYYPQDLRDRPLTVLGAATVVVAAVVVLIRVGQQLDIHRYQSDDIRKLSSSRETRWGWAITTRQTGNLKFYLNLRYAISREGQEFRLVPGSPVYERAIKAMPPESDSTQKATDRPWWQRILGGMFERISRLFGA